MTDLTTADTPEPHYEFGKNWQHFVDTQLTPERLDSSRRNLLTLLNLPDLTGKTFLDIGCGSGLHSLSAWQSGAERITSFDYDPDSVTTTRRLHALAGSPSNWTITQGDILDPGFLNTLSAHDIVYSWGVLHHTGSMWQAVENAGRLVNEQGLFAIALYTTDNYQRPSTQDWLRIKRQYNQAGPWERARLEWWYFARFVALPDLAHFKNPMRRFPEYAQSRGMSLWTDIRDWLGGWPMEFAGIMETRTFCRDRLSMDLLWMTAGEACTEYLFARQGDSARHWKERNSLEAIPLTPPFRKTGTHSFQTTVPDPISPRVLEADRLRSNWALFENQEPLGYPNAKLHVISESGGGGFRHRGNVLTFSSSDGSNPNSNGRTYQFCRRIGPLFPPPVRPLSF